MKDLIDVQESRPPTEEQKLLVSLFSEINKGQVEFLDQSAKRIVELCTALLGILFTVAAFGDKFPPVYIKDNSFGKSVLVVVLFCFMTSLVLGVVELQPRKYKFYEHNLTMMKSEYEKIVHHKSRLLSWAGALFVLGSLAFTILIGSIIFAN